jgi:RHS repeat-associated protein
LGYTVDPVGNRTALNSTLPGIPSATQVYDADDRLTVDTYDANGNTLTSSGKTFAYDFANRLTSVNAGAVTMLYDGDDNRVAKGSTQYLVDEQSPTGLSQVVEEISSGAVQRSYAYGLQRISQDRVVSGSIVPTFYSYDGHGDVRLLTDSTGTVTDTYDYDSFGNLINSTGSTPNVYLYQGEQFDSETGFYYLRARYYNPATGRLLTVDSAMTADDNPASAHPYLYAGANPVNQTDPTGQAFESALALQLVAIVADPHLIPTSSISNNFTSGTFTFVGRQFVCIMSNVASLLNTAVGGFNFGDCTSNVSGFGGPTSGSSGGSSGSGGSGAGGAGGGSGCKCFAQLKNRPVDDWRARIVNAQHSFWWVQDSTGARHIISAFPAPPNGTIQYLNIYPEPGDGSGVDNSRSHTQWSSGLSYAVCNAVARMLAAASAFPRNRIHYDAFNGPNSNSGAHYIAEAAGFNFAVPWNFIAWGVEILVPMR